MSDNLEIPADWPTSWCRMVYGLGLLTEAASGPRQEEDRENETLGCRRGVRTSPLTAERSVGMCSFCQATPAVQQGSVLRMLIFHCAAEIDQPRYVQYNTMTPAINLCHRFQ
jgi:hypothetical protein